MWKASELTHLYGHVASAQSLFSVPLLGLKQLGNQIIYEQNNEGLSPAGHGSDSGHVILNGPLANGNM